MIAAWLVGVLIGSGLIAWAIGGRAPRWSRLVALAAIGGDLVLLAGFWVVHWGDLGAGPVASAGGGGAWLTEANYAWIPQLGISAHVAVDGFSLLLLLLTMLLGLVAVLISWREIDHRVGFFHLNVLWVLAGIVGVFTSLDLFLFYFFWELMLVPMYFLIAIWGHERRHYASMKFFLFTQASGLLMLVAILALVFAHAAQTGQITFDYEALLGTPLSRLTATLAMLGFFAAFAVKLPAVPFHTWLPDAHTEAPTAGSVILAGLMLKTGAYGMIRFLVPLFPKAALDFAPVAMTLGAIGVLYGALVAYSQRDFKRLVAYTSVGHMALVMLGIFAWNRLALQGVVIMMVSHAISTGGLFVIAGQLQERLHTRDMDRMSGFWGAAPRMGGFTMLFAMATLGLPGLGNFVGEFLILAGAYQAGIGLAAVAAAGIVAATIYSLRLVQLTFHGPQTDVPQPADLSWREGLVLGGMAAAIIAVGFVPQPLLRTSEDGIARAQQVVASARQSTSAAAAPAPAAVRAKGGGP